MNYIEEEQKLVIDLSKENYESKELLAYDKLKSIRFEEYSDIIDLAPELKNVNTLESLYFSGVKEVPGYKLPLGIAKLTQVRDLTVWSYCDVEALPFLSHIQTLSIIVKEPYIEMQTIVSRFPNLKKLILWGSFLQSKALPPEIGLLKDLEYLEMVSTGVSELPSEFVQLTNLKYLEMRGTYKGDFPEVLCEMPWLESLCYNLAIKKLPQNLTKMTSLKKLNLFSSLNKGTVSPTFSTRPLKAIPDVIGSLSSLEELNLSNCGVMDIAVLKNLKALKKLEINYSGLDNCDDIAHLTQLNTLSLESSHNLADISGLNGLPLMDLNISACSRLKSLNTILDLEQLKTLNIERCEGFKNIEAIYSHVSLKNLKADDELEGKWQYKDDYMNLPSLNKVLSSLVTDNTKIFEEAVSWLNIHVEKKYYNEKNPLASYFKDKHQDGGLIYLTILDEAFLKLKDKVSSQCLINLVTCSLRTVVKDSFYITVLAIQEMIKRQDIQAQVVTVDIFNKACSSYDSGHREMGNTVLDQVFDDLFEGFETKALINFLNTADSDMLNCKSGDCGDRLFFAAFSKSQSDEDTQTLIETFVQYQKELIEYLGLEYFTSMHKEILSSLDSKNKQKFKDAVA